MRDGNEVHIDEQPHYFALRLKKLAIDFYCTLTDSQKGSYDETVKAFRALYTETCGIQGTASKTNTTPRRKAN